MKLLKTDKINMSKGSTQGFNKVLIADDDGQLKKRMYDFFKENGMEIREAESGREVREILAEWIPNFIIVDLMLPEFNALEILKFVNTEEKLKSQAINVIVTSGHNSLDNVKECLKAGASDYVVKPFKYQDMFNRLVFLAQKKRDIKFEKGKLEGGDHFLHLTDLVLKEANSNRKTSTLLFNFSKMVGMTLKAVRCSVIECHENRQQGWVRASSDDIKVNNIELDLNKYPEVLHVMNSEEIVVVENMEKDPSLAEIKKVVKTISFNSMIVCPLFRRGQFYGVLSARMDKDHSNFTDRNILFTQLVANVINLILSADLPLPIELQRAS